MTEIKDFERIEVDPANTALVLIDIQREVDKFIRGEGFDVPNPDHERKKEIVPVVQDLADRARAANVRVVYTQSIRNGTEPEFKVFGRIPILQVGTWHSDMVEELTPQRDDIVVRKWVPDPWYETDFERVFTGLYPDPTKTTILLTGGSITGCAYFGIIGFCARGYRVVVVSDGVYGPITQALRQFSRTTYPTFGNVSLTRSDLITFRAPDIETRAAGSAPAAQAASRAG